MAKPWVKRCRIIDFRKGDGEDPFWYFVTEKHEWIQAFLFSPEDVKFIVRNSIKGEPMLEAYLTDIKPIAVVCDYAVIRGSKEKLERLKRKIHEAECFIP